MRKVKNNRYITNIVKIIILTITLMMFSYFNNNKVYAGEQYKEQNLSEILYDQTKSYVGYDQIRYNRIDNGSKITLMVNGVKTQFDKGIWAHASSAVYYDISNYQGYEYFVTYYGVNANASYNEDGVKFYIYTSADGNDWKLITPENPPVHTSRSNAGKVEVRAEGIKYIKLVAEANSNIHNDHAVYGGAKLVTYTNDIQRPEYYDEKIKELYNIHGPEYKNDSTGNYEHYILKRNFIKNLGYENLQKLINENEDDKIAYEWLTNDINNIRMYTTGGKPNGSYYNSMKVLSQLYKEYKADMDNVIFKKMLISISLTHAERVRFWINDQVLKDGRMTNNTDPNSPNVSVPTERYRVLKELYLANKFDQKEDIFENIEVELMRYITGANMADGQMKWLNDYTTAKNNSKNPYDYITYLNENHYYDPKYYSEEQKEHWVNKYKLTGYDVHYQKGYPTQWIIFEEGGVCWQISNTGQNMLSTHGVPSITVGQPIHVAYFIYKVDKDKNKHWQIGNDVFGWTKTNDQGYSADKAYYPVRFLNGWGHGSYASPFSGSYILLAQSAINNFAKYEEAEIKLLLANVYDDAETKKHIFESSLDTQDINFDSWLNVIYANIADTSKTDEELYQLAIKVTEKLTFYPLPMHDLLRLITPRLQSAAYKSKIMMLETTALNRAKVAKRTDQLQDDVVRIMANHLLGNVDNEVAKFSFDGENPNQIILADRFKNSSVAWDYSLDNGQTWKQVTENSVTLTDEEIQKITVENDIKVHIIGVDYSPENIFTIDITKANVPAKANQGNPKGIYANDDENKIIFAQPNMLWKLEGTEEWVSFKTANPDLSGNKKVKVKYANTGHKLSSDEIELTFTENSKDDKYTYIPISEVRLDSASTESPDHEQGAANAIDGNPHTLWHTRWDGQDNQKYIIFNFTETKKLSKIKYQPTITNWNNGRVLGMTVLVGPDKDHLTEIVSNKELQNNNNEKEITFDSIDAKYVKIVGVNTVGNYMTAGEFKFYEDLTSTELPEGNVTYDVNALTNSSVVATLEYDITKVNIVNNNSNNTYTFNENGVFNFEIESKKSGRRATIKAEVTWIDKVKPEAEVTYQESPDKVIATIVPNEPIDVLNNDGKLTYEFTENKEFTFIIMDKAGNQNQIKAKVTSLREKEEEPFPAADVSFDISNITNKSVKATLINKTKGLVVTNNNSLDYYVFEENGTFTFNVQNSKGETDQIHAHVNWIDKKAPVGHIEYVNNGNNTITAKLTANEDIIPGNQQHIFTSNGTYTFTFKDLAGNNGQAVATVTTLKTQAEIEQEKEIERQKQEQNQNNQNSQNNQSNNNQGNENNSNQYVNNNTANNNVVNHNNTVNETLSNNDIRSQVENHTTIEQNVANNNLALQNQEEIETLKEDEENKKRNEEFVTTKQYKIDKGNVEIKFLSKANENYSLRKTEISLPEDIKTQIKNKIESFNLTLMKDGKLIDEIGNMEVKIKLDNTKNIENMYILVNNKLSKIEYEVTSDEYVTIKVNKLGNFIIEYKKDNKNKINYILPIICIALLVGITTYIIVYKKNNKK